MNRDKINKINLERLTRWKSRLNDAHSTSAILIGIGHDHKQGMLTILVTEDTKNQDILLLLQEACRMLEVQINQRQ